MFQVDKPRDTDIHTRADFAEILCLFNLDRTCSRETIQDHIHDNNAGNQGRIDDADMDDLFGHIEWRMRAFGDFYPFSFHTPQRVFRSEDNLTEKQRLYVFLLLCANFPFVTVATNDLADAFERLSLIVMGNSWFQNGTVRAFGKNEAEYVGAKWERFNLLAADIGARQVCNARTFREADRGDGGIDLAAWKWLDQYERRNNPTGLAQCACSRNQWVSKQNDISYTRLSGNLPPSNHWLQTLFIPQCFRGNQGEWACEGDVGMTVIFDRLRMLNNVGEHVDWGRIDPPQLFEEFLDYRFDLV